MRVHCFTEAYKLLVEGKDVKWTLEAIKDYIAKPYKLVKDENGNKISEYIVDENGSPIPITSLQQLIDYNKNAYLVLNNLAKANNEEAIRIKGDLPKLPTGMVKWTLEAIKDYIAKPYKLVKDENGKKIKEYIVDENGSPIPITSLQQLIDYNKSALIALDRLVKANNEEAIAVKNNLSVTIRWDLDTIKSFISKPFRIRSMTQVKDGQSALMHSKKEYIVDENGSPIPITRSQQLLDYSRGAYQALNNLVKANNEEAIAIKNSLLDLGSPLDRCLYKATVDFNGIHYVYIGLTYNYDKRSIDHLKADVQNPSAIYRFLDTIGLAVKDVKFEQLTDYMEEEAASEAERSQISYYKKLQVDDVKDENGWGWKLLNRNKGGGLGGRGISLVGLVGLAAKYDTFESMGVIGRKWLEKCAFFDVNSDKMWRVSRVYKANLDARLSTKDKSIYLFRDRRNIGSSPFYVGN